MSTLRRAADNDERPLVMCALAASNAPSSSIDARSSLIAWSVARRAVAASAVSTSLSVPPTAAPDVSEAATRAASASTASRVVIRGPQTLPRSAPLRERSTSFRSLRTVSASRPPTATMRGRAAANSLVDSERRRMNDVSFGWFLSSTARVAPCNPCCDRMNTPLLERVESLSGPLSSILRKSEHSPRQECEQGPETTRSGGIAGAGRFLCDSSSFPELRPIGGS